MIQPGFLQFGRYNTYMLIAKYDSCSVCINVSLITENTEILFVE